jgi:hypothetical protein
LSKAVLTEPTDHPDEGEDDELLRVIGEVHAEPCPEYKGYSRTELNGHFVMGHCVIGLFVCASSKQRLISSLRNTGKVIT